MSEEHARHSQVPYLGLDRLETQVAVVGGGAAGLYTAIRAAREGAPVVLVSATPLARSSTFWAQGGLAAAIGDDDSPERHLADTISAGFTPRSAARGRSTSTRTTGVRGGVARCTSTAPGTLPTTAATRSATASSLSAAARVMGVPRSTLVGALRRAGA